MSDTANKAKLEGITLLMGITSLSSAAKTALLKLVMNGSFVVTANTTIEEKDGLFTVTSGESKKSFRIVDDSIKYHGRHEVNGNIEVYENGVVTQTEHYSEDTQTLTTTTFDRANNTSKTTTDSFAEFPDADGTGFEKAELENFKTWLLYLIISKMERSETEQDLEYYGANKDAHKRHLPWLEKFAQHKGYKIVTNSYGTYLSWKK
jgi:hypothetical protein